MLYVVFSVDMLLLASMNNPWRVSAVVWQRLFNYTEIRAGDMLVVTMVFIA